MNYPETRPDDPRVKRLQQSESVSRFMKLVQQRIVLASHQSSTLGRDLTFDKANEMRLGVEQAEKLLYAAIVDELSRRKVSEELAE